MPTLSSQTKLGDLLSNDAAKAVLEKHIPGISTHPQIAMGREMPLATVASFSGGLITDEMLKKVDVDLIELA